MLLPIAPWVVGKPHSQGLQVTALQNDKQQFHGEHCPPLAMIFSVAYQWNLSIFCAHGCLMLEFASVKGLRPFDFNVQEGQAVNSDIGSVMPFVVLVVPSSFGLKAKLMGADIGYLKLPTFAFVICIHSASCQLLLWLSSSPSSASQSAPKLCFSISGTPSSMRSAITSSHGWASCVSGCCV